MICDTGIRELAQPTEEIKIGPRDVKVVGINLTYEEFLIKVIAERAVISYP